jgi:hypothetical protein
MVASAGTADPLVEPAGPVNGPTVDELVRAEPPLPEEALEAAEAPRETVASSVVVQLDPTPPPGQEPHAPDVAEIAASLRPSMPGRIPPAPVSPQPLGSIPLALRQMGDWAELRRLTRASLPVIGGWLAMVLVVGTLTAQTLTTSVTDQLLGSGPLSVFGGSSLFGSLTQVVVGAVASLVGGLGYQVTGGASIGVFGTDASASAIGSVAVVPLGALLVLAALAAFGARRALADHPDASWSAAAVRVTAVAAISALAVYVLAAFAGSTFSADGNPGGSLFGASVSVTGGPMLDHLVVVLFPLLWLGAALGVADQVVWESGLSGQAARRVRRSWTIVRSGLEGYLAALLTVSALVVLGLGYLAVSGTLGSEGGLVGLVPLVLTLVPNLAGLVIAAGSGAPVSVGGATGSVWQMGPLLALVGVGALVLPGLIAGRLLARRVPDATPLEVAGAGLVTLIATLLAAALALPSLAASGSAGAYGSSETAALGFDVGQAALIVTIATVIATYLGFMAAAGTTAATRALTLEPTGEQL